MNTETQNLGSSRPLPLPAISATGGLRVYDFLDYRKFLKAFYEQTKRATKGRFSYRLFSNRTGVDSPNYLKLIVDGDRNLTPAHAKRVAKYCGLGEAETKFFLSLVKWNQSKPGDEQTALWSELLTQRSQSGFQKLSSSQLAVMTDLRLVALFELVQVLPEATAETLAASLSLPMTSVEIARGLATLQAAGLVRVSGKKISVVTKTLKSEDDVPSKTVRQYHQQAMAAAKAALENVPVERREYLSTTISLPHRLTPEVKAVLRETRDKLLALSESSAGADSVFQINIQFFPLTNLKQEIP